MRPSPIGSPWTMRGIVDGTVAGLLVGAGLGGFAAVTGEGPSGGVGWLLVGLLYGGLSGLLFGACLGAVVDILIVLGLGMPRSLVIALAVAGLCGIILTWGWRDWSLLWAAAMAIAALDLGWRWHVHRV